MKKIWDFYPTFRFRLQKQIIRHLSNYFSSVFAVIDYSRKTIRKYFQQNEEVITRFNQAKDSFLADRNFHKVIQDLRNYTSHNTFIKTGSEFSYNIEWTESRKSIYVTKSEMLEWDGWSQYPRAFIKSQDGKIRLNEILATHYNSFTDFQ